MIHKEIFDVFVKYKKIFEDLSSNDEYINLLQSNGTNLFVYPDIPFDVELQTKRKFNLFDKEKILFIRDLSLERCLNEGMIITDCELLFIIDEGNEIFIEWNDIKNVEYREDNLCFYGSFLGKSELVVDSYKFFKKNEAQIYGKLFARMFTEMAKTYIVDESVEIESCNCNKMNLELKENTTFDVKAETVGKYPKEEIDKFKDQSISKVRNLLIIWSVLAFICLLIGGFMVIIPIVFAIPIIILLFSYLSLINKDDDYWEREYSKLWKNLSDVDKLKTAAKIAGGIFKLFG